MLWAYLYFHQITLDTHEKASLSVGNNSHYDTKKEEQVNRRTGYTNRAKHKHRLSLFIAKKQTTSFNEITGHDSKV